MARTIRNVITGALLAAIPVSMSAAAVRPTAAVPAAGSTVMAAQDYDTNRSSIAATWPVWVFAAGMVGLVLWQVLDDDEDEDGPITRG